MPLLGHFPSCPVQSITKSRRPECCFRALGPIWYPGPGRGRGAGCSHICRGPPAAVQASAPVRRPRAIHHPHDRGTAARSFCPADRPSAPRPGPDTPARTPRTISQLLGELCFTSWPPSQPRLTWKCEQSLQGAKRPQNLLCSFSSPTSNAPASPPLLPFVLTRARAATGPLPGPWGQVLRACAHSDAGPAWPRRSPWPVARGVGAWARRSVSSENRTLTKTPCHPPILGEFSGKMCVEGSLFLGSEIHRAAFPGGLRSARREAVATDQP